MAGEFTGAYLFSLLVCIGFGMLSRLRPLIVGRFQFRSMNFRIETWSE